MTMETEEEDVDDSGKKMNEEADTVGMSRYFCISYRAYLRKDPNYSLAETPFF